MDETYVEYEVNLSSAVPAFLLKLYHIVDSEEYNYCIKWDEDGKGLCISDQMRLAKEILPMFFKHSNMSSFIRQLNMYGFQKTLFIENQVPSEDEDAIHFRHPSFVRGHEELLLQIKRKPPQLRHKEIQGVQSQPDPASNQKIMEQMVVNMADLQSKQQDMSTKLDSMRKENEALWREFTKMKNQHTKQHQTVNQLIHFLGALLTKAQTAGKNTRNKRKRPLMIDGPVTANSAAPSTSKITRTDDDIPSSYFVDSLETKKTPKIHDITDKLLKLQKQRHVTDNMIDSILEQQDHAYHIPVETTITNIPETQDSSTVRNITTATQSGASNQQPLSNNSKYVTNTQMPGSSQQPGVSNELYETHSQPPGPRDVKPFGSVPLFDDLVDLGVVSNLNSGTIQLPEPNKLALQRSNSMQDMSQYLDSVDLDLTSLKDILDDQYQLDASTLQTLLNVDGNKAVGLESLFQDIPPWIDDVDDENTTTGNELIAYAGDPDLDIFLPSLLESPPILPTTVTSPLSIHSPINDTTSTSVIPSLINVDDLD